MCAWCACRARAQARVYVCVCVCICVRVYVCMFWWRCSGILLTEKFISPLLKLTAIKHLPFKTGVGKNLAVLASSRGRYSTWLISAFLVHLTSLSSQILSSPFGLGYCGRRNWSLLCWEPGLNKVPSSKSGVDQNSFFYMLRLLPRILAY